MTTCKHRTSKRTYPPPAWDDLTHTCLDCGATFDSSLPPLCDCDSVDGPHETTRACY